MNKKAIIILTVVLAVSCALAASVFWYRLGAFYKACVNIQIGMTAEEAEVILSPYLDNPKYSHSRDGALWGEGLYVSSNVSGNECDISIKEGRVDKIDLRFE